MISIPNSTIIVNYTIGSATAPGPQTVTVSSDLPATITSETITYPPSAGSGWLFIPPPGVGLALPTSLSLYVTPGTLAAGTYAAQVQLGFSGTVDPSSTTTITVFLIVAAAGGGGAPNESITLSATSLSFAYQLGGAVPAAQAITVTTSDGASFSVTAVTNDGNPWLLVSPAAAASPGTINISVSPASLASGTYTGTVTVAGPSQTAQVTVTLTVSGGVLSANPAVLMFNVPQNYGLSAPQGVQITSSPSVAISIAVASDQGWLIADQSSGKTPDTINVRANVGALPQGNYQGTVTVQAGLGNFALIPVTLTIGAPATLSLAPASLSFSYVLGTTLPPAQTTKVNSLTGSTQSFTVASTTNDGAAWLTGTATPGTTPGVVTVTVSPAALAAGSYSGTVNVTATGAGSSPEPIVVSLTVMNPPPPVVSAITSSASYATGIVAPGEYVTIFGSALGPNAIALPPPGTAPTTLANTTVTFDGLPAPILYASASQTSVQVPYGITIGQTKLIVSYLGYTSVAMTVNSAAVAPGLFTANSSGFGQAAALNQDLSVNSASNPATRGMALVLYGTGEGQTNPASVAGTITGVVAPFPVPLIQPVTVTIGGQVASVAYAGETPSLLSGLFQINVTIPPAAPTGPAVPVQVFVGNQPSQANVTVAIQ